METQTNTNMKWYVVRAQSNKERSVAEKLIKQGERGDLMGKIGEVIVPLDKKISIVNGKKVTRDVVIFQGYIFIQTNAVGELKYHLKGMDGASGFLTSRDGKVQPLSKAEVDQMIKRKQDYEVKETLIESTYVPGQEILILDGPFKEFVGTITEVNVYKVKINVSIFGRITPVELNSSQITNKPQ